MIIIILAIQSLSAGYVVCSSGTKSNLLCRMLQNHRIEFRVEFLVTILDFLLDEMTQG